MGQTAAAQAGGPPGVQNALGAAAQTVAVHLTAPVSIQLVLLAVGLALTGGILADALRRVD